MQERMLEVLFSVVFLAQVLLISWILPRRLLRKMDAMIRSHPPGDYPRLYPVPMVEIEAARRTYRAINGSVLLLGLVLVAASLLWPENDWLHWSNGIVPGTYFLLQVSPWVVVGRSPGFSLFNQRRDAGATSLRRADLAPRHASDVIPSGLLGAAIVLYMALIVLVAYVDQFDYPWFGGYWNVVSVGAMNAFLAGFVVLTFHGRKIDPYQTGEDRVRQMAGQIRVALWASVTLSTFVMLAISLRALDLTDYIPIAMSVYFQILVLLVFQDLRVDELDFEVYRDEPGSP